MKRGIWIWLVLMLAVGGIECAARAPGESSPTSRLLLKEHWLIQSSAQVQDKGEVLSTTQYTPRGWYRADVPTTVLNALIENKVYPDPYFGMNLRTIPGTQYPIGENFSDFPMPPDSPFRIPWWYRREFQLPPVYRGKTIWLRFEGINFRANIWLNGHRIADSSRVAGAYRFFEFDISDTAVPGGTNVLAVEVFPPQADDLAITWIDVNPAPPDKGMGLWHEVSISTSGPVALRYPQVISRLDLPSLDTAHLTVNADLHNASGRTIEGVLAGQIEEVHFQQEVEIGPHEWKRVSFNPERFPQLNLSHPRLWWPWQMGSQNMYQLGIEFRTDGQASDRQQVDFGIREITSELTPEGSRLFKVNGQKILVRGALWWSDMLSRSQPERQEIELQYAKDMHLNCLRMDGKFEDDHFLNLADRYGILLMPGWACCDHWERWKTWKEEDYTIAVASTQDRIRWFRNHPSVLTWLNGDDNPPVPRVEKAFIKVLEEENWPNPYQSHSGGKPSAVTGSTGYKGSLQAHYGPYDYVPPNYWLLDHTRGGGWGFITETSPGPAIPPMASLRRFIPSSHLWPIDQYWNFHAGGGEFNNIKVYTQALNARYGEATGVEDFTKKAQVMDYEGQRAMFEAYGRNKYVATGVLKEMLSNAWPSLIWVLYDYYLRPAGAYFGTKKACEPLHIQYSYDDRSIFVVNSYYREFKGLKATAHVYNFDLSEKFCKETTLDVAPDSSNKVFMIPELDGLSAVYFVRLTLKDSGDKTVSRNFYWLSTKPDVLDWEKTVFSFTPTKSFADLTDLQKLPRTEIVGSSTAEQKEGNIVMHVAVENPRKRKTLAFFVYLRVTRGKGGKEVLPILWEDNCFELMPGERREITATVRAKDLQNATPVVEVDGWNVAKSYLDQRVAR